MVKRSLERSRNKSAQAKIGDGDIALIVPHRATFFRGGLIPVNDNIDIVVSVETPVLDPPNTPFRTAHADEPRCIARVKKDRKA